MTPSPQTRDAGGNRFINDEPFVHKRKPSSMALPNSKRQKNYGDHMLIPVTVKMIHSALSADNKFVLKDGHLSTGKKSF